MRQDWNVVGSEHLSTRPYRLLILQRPFEIVMVWRLVYEWPPITGVLVHQLRHTVQCCEHTAAVEIYSDCSAAEQLADKVKRRNLVARIDFWPERSVQTDTRPRRQAQLLLEHIWTRSRNCKNYVRPTTNFENGPPAGEGRVNRDKTSLSAPVAQKLVITDTT
ncbi:hypothetical protein J6590_004775 [Homalodisca vitripennis]|nr:hypothetical protein J6590_004775 [Homalodisca vitripennis]